MNPTSCQKCDDTGLIYQAGSYGWDGGNYAFCDCPEGVKAEKTMYDAYNEDPKDVTK